ncbi:MAG: class I SAM-dependent methyltransferase [Candidatus Pacearchaeota archaeon]
MQNQYDHSTANLRESVFSENRFNPLHERFLEYVGKTEPLGRILDIGTGNGYILREIQKRYPGKYQLIGIDNSPEMLTKANSFGGGIDYKLADNYNLPFGEDNFATVTAKNVTRFSVEELARVLQTRGLFVFREYGEGKGLVEIANLFQGRLVRSHKPDFYIAQLNKAGFEDISLEQFAFQRQYTQDELLKIVQMFPFVEDLNDSDLEIIKEFYEGREFIKITSDPFILTARRKQK